MKILTIERTIFKVDRTLGELLDFEKKHFSWTLEDAVRDGEKIYGKTAIPEGTYEVVVSFSDRFNRRLPLLLHVPGYTGIRFHGGNGPDNTLGCPLIGELTDKNRIWQCAGVVDALTELIEETTKKEKVFAQFINKRS